MPPQLASILAALILLTAGHVTVHDADTALIFGGAPAQAWRTCTDGHADIWFTPSARDESATATFDRTWEYAGAYDCMTDGTASAGCDLDLFTRATGVAEGAWASGADTDLARSDCYAAQVTRSGMILGGW